MLLAAAHLPDPLVVPLPVLADVVQQVAQVEPGVVGDRRGVLVVDVDRVHQLAVDVELELVDGAVADPHRAGAAVPLEIVERDLGQVAPAVDAVDDFSPTIC